MHYCSSDIFLLELQNYPVTFTIWTLFDLDMAALRTVSVVSRSGNYSHRILDTWTFLQSYFHNTPWNLQMLSTFAAYFLVTYQFAVDETQCIGEGDSSAHNSSVGFDALSFSYTQDPTHQR